MKARFPLLRLMLEGQPWQQYARHAPRLGVNPDQHWHFYELGRDVTVPRYISLMFDLCNTIFCHPDDLPLLALWVLLLSFVVAMHVTREAWPKRSPVGDACYGRSLYRFYEHYAGMRKDDATCGLDRTTSVLQALNESISSPFPCHIHISACS